MSKFAVISDIHGNLEALTAVCRDYQHLGIKNVYSIGDMIDYGADSNEVIELLKKNNVQCTLGNHEAALFDQKLLSLFTAVARKSMSVTSKLLSEKSIQFINKLPVNIVTNQFTFVHGKPPYSVMNYLYPQAVDTLSGNFNQLSMVTFIGHTHIPALYDFGTVGTEPVRLEIELPEHSLSPKHKYIVNVGSVGQSRTGDKYANYVIFDTRKWSLCLRQLAYNRARAAKKIIEKGYPQINALRIR